MALYSLDLVGLFIYIFGVIAFSTTTTTTTTYDCTLYRLLDRQAGVGRIFCLHRQDTQQFCLSILAWCDCRSSAKLHLPP